MLIKPSKKVLFSAILMSLTLHIFICRIPVQSALPSDNDTQNLSLSLFSVAAPNVIEEEKVEKVVASIAPKKQTVKKRVIKPRKQSTSNDKGMQKSTITPVLKATDFVQTVAPKYPRRAIDRGIQGQVLVKVKISRGGVPESVNLASSSGFSDLDKSALKAVSKWKFNNSAFLKSAHNWVLVPVNFVIR